MRRGRERVGGLGVVGRRREGWDGEQQRHWWEVSWREWLWCCCRGVGERIFLLLLLAFYLTLSLSL